MYSRGVVEPEDAFNRELGANIKRLRGRTPQASIAEAAGVSRTSLVLIEQGKQRVHAYVLTRLATSLGTSVQMLLPTVTPVGRVTTTADVGAPKRVREWVDQIVSGAEAPGGGHAHEPESQGKGRSRERPRPA